MMTAMPTDAPAMHAAADAVVVNLATLTTDTAQAIEEYLPLLHIHPSNAVPWVLDPAAIGLPPRRNALARTLLAASPTILRANASEILHLAGSAGGGRGPDSTATVAQAGRMAQAIAHDYATTVAVSGATDVIVDAQRKVSVTGGVAQLPRVTGTGCLLGGLCAACAAVEPDPYYAALAATTWLNTAGERAAASATRCGSFKVALIDALEELAL